MKNLLVRGGTVLDGTGAAGFRADVRIRNGRIAEVGANLRVGDERVIDAGGAYVTPGLIECHTHYDGPMWWMPSLDPLPGYGATTAVMGNCGLSVAPMSANMADRRGMIGIFSFLEDIPQRTFEKEMPWNWQSWGEYRRALRDCPSAANLSTFVGHLNLRIAVMGEAAWERKANAEERAMMAAMLDDGLKHGALGLSTNFFDNDANDRPVPTKLADEAELIALLDVMARYKGVILQFIANLLKPHEIVNEVEYLSKLCTPRNVRMQLLAIPSSREDTGSRNKLVQFIETANANGADIWSGYGVRPLSVSLNFERTLVFNLQGAFAWDELSNKTPKDQKIAKLKDPEWRARARHEWDNLKPGAVLNRVEHYLNNSENGVGPVDVTLSAYAKELGLHTSDALAEWLVRNGTGSTVGEEPRPLDDNTVVEMLHKPFTLTGVSDAGAHGQLFCGAGVSSYLLTHFVRDSGQISVEKMVQVLTSQIATHYNLADRGVIAPGKIADIAVFALDEIDFRPEQRVVDVPDGEGGMSWRYTRAPAPFRATIVNGVPTFENGAYTGELPGTLIGPGTQHISLAAD
jgi:N-acyl-D-amino-acid deacylase